MAISAELTNGIRIWIAIFLIQAVISNSAKIGGVNATIIDHLTNGRDFGYFTCGYRPSFCSAAAW
jgi:hypothetical protein